MGLVRRICNVYSSRVSPVALRCAVQLSAGQLLVALPVLISYPNFLSRVAWIATINYSAPMYLIAADKHTSTLIMAILRTTGDMSLGVLLAGLMVTLAQLPGTAYTTFLCIFTAIGLIPLSTARARVPTPGMMCTLMYGVSILLGQFTARSELWKTVTAYMLLVNAITGAGALSPHVFIMPTTAKHECKQVMQQTLLELGQQISNYASALFSPMEEGQKCTAALARELSRCLDYGPDLQHDAVSVSSTIQDSNPDSATIAGAAGGAIQLSSIKRVAAREKEVVNDEHADANHSKDVSPSAESIRQGILEETQPGRQAFPGSNGHAFKAINSLRPAVLKAKRLIQESQFEPWIPVHHAKLVQHWTAAIDAVDHVILTAAALESVLEGEAPLLVQGSLFMMLERVGVLADFQLVYTELAASCSAMAAAVAAYHQSRQGASAAFQLLLRPAWAALEHELAQAVQQAIQGYWHRWRHQPQHEDMFSPEIQSRACMYLFTLTHSVMEAMANAEQAIELATATTALGTPATASIPAESQSATAAAVCTQSGAELLSHNRQTLPTKTEQSGRQALRSNQTAQQAQQAQSLNGTHEQGAQQAQHAHINPLHEALQRVSHTPSDLADSNEEEPLIAAPKGLLQMSLDQRPAKKYFDRLGVEVHVPMSNTQQLQKQPLMFKSLYYLRWLCCQLQLLWPVVQSLLAWGIWMDWLHMPRETWDVVKSRQKQHEVLRSCTFQYGVKYWTCNALVLCVAIIVSEADKPDHLASWHPLFLVATVNVVFSEKVDATLAKSVQRVTGSVIGCVYGFLVMLRPVVASNPYAVGALCCFSAFMCGLLVEHRFKYGSFLALYTSAVVILAQYNSASGSHGSVKFMYARIADIFMGTVITSLFTLVLPWYAREDALGKLGAAVAEGAQLIEDLYLAFYQELQKPLLPDQARAVGNSPSSSNVVAEKAASSAATAKRVGLVLAGIQAQIAKEAVVWRAGPLVMAPLVKSSLGAAQVMLERIAAVEAMLQQAPIVSGRFTPAPFLHLAQPLHQDMSAAVAAASQLGRAIRAVLCAHPSQKALQQPLQHLTACIHEAVETRVAFRLRYWAVRAADHAEARKPANSAWLRERTLDDAVRYLSFVFAAGKACDKVVLLARMVETDPWIKKSAQQKRNFPWHFWDNQKATLATNTAKAS